MSRADGMIEALPLVPTDAEAALVAAVRTFALEVERVAGRPAVAEVVLDRAFLRMAGAVVSAGHTSVTLVVRS